MEEKKIVLIDAVFINNGGGKILLDYLYEKVNDSSAVKYVFLIDSRLKNEYERKSDDHINIVFLDGFLQRTLFYKKNKINFQSVLSFGNIPPTKKLEAKVYTYFHQLIYINIPSEFSLIDQLKFRIKIQILRMLIKNTDFWIVQNELMKRSFSKKYSIEGSKILVLPFYPPLIGNEKEIRKEKSFIFVSNANPHKNHKNLINAFCRFYDNYNDGFLTLTVNENFPDIINLIAEKKSQNYPIHNIGFVSRERLVKEYKTHQYLIFPSLAESFGLGVVEAIENGCKVIGSDLPYMHEVCEPSILIQKPQNKDNIFEALISSVHYEKVPFSKQKIHNEIEKLINLLDN